MSKIQNVFGKFAAEIEGEVVLFDTETQAAMALSAFENEAKNTALAEKYLDAVGLEGKNRKGKLNIIIDFLAWVDSGEAEKVLSEEDTAIEEVPFETKEEEKESEDDGEDPLAGLNF